MAAGSRLLDGRTRDRPVGAKDAAVAGRGLQAGAASRTVVEELAGVRWHPLRRLVSAVRAGDNRLLDHGITLEGYPACVVADIRASGAVFWSSYVTVAVLRSKDTTTLSTPGTLAKLCFTM